MQVRAPVFASQGWYPKDERSCRQSIEEFVEKSPEGLKGRYAAVVPHAGWAYSGRTAAKAFASLREEKPDVVFLFGGHMHPDHRCVCMPQGAFATPLGSIEVHEEMAREFVKTFDCDEETPTQFVPDNTIELQLPFIKWFWPDARIVAAGVPPNQRAEGVGIFSADLAARYNLQAVAIGSTDLTHYGPSYGFTPRGTGSQAHQWSKEQNDRMFIDDIMALDAQSAVSHALANQSACCGGAAAAAVGFARARGVKRGILVDHVTSHEVQGKGNPTTWVGYAAIVF